MLRASILLVHRDFRNLSTLSIQNIVRDLQHWYDGLPDHMGLDSLGQDTMPAEMKRSICHTHLLYLGAIVLLYRRIAPQVLLSHEHAETVTMWKPHEKILIERAEQAVLAATTSARVGMVLHEQKGIFRRCWLVMYVFSSTSCTPVFVLVYQLICLASDFTLTLHA